MGVEEGKFEDVFNVENEVDDNVDGFDFEKNVEGVFEGFVFDIKVLDEEKYKS